MTRKENMVECDYRLFRSRKDEYYEIKLCYYNDKGEPKGVHGFHEPVIGNSIEEAKEDYKKKGDAFNKPVLDLDPFMK